MCGFSDQLKACLCQCLVIFIDHPVFLIEVVENTGDIEKIVRDHVGFKMYDRILQYFRISQQDLR